MDPALPLRYRPIRLLGRGGMGEVHLAADTADGDREVAIKICGAPSVERFLAAEEKRSGRRTRIDADALGMLAEHDWPGNVRELENEVRRLAVLGSGRIRAGDLEGLARGQAGGTGVLVPGAVDRLSWEEARDAVDRAYLQAALEAEGGDARAVARRLGVHERTVYKLRKRLWLASRAGKEE